MVYGRWCPLANTGSTAYGLEPGPESVFVLCVCFFLTFVTGTTTATESTVQRDNTSHMYNTSTFFLIFFFFVHDVYEKIKVGLRWSEPTYLHIGYVFESDFAGGMN